MADEMMLVRLGAPDALLHGKAIGTVTKKDSRPVTDDERWVKLVLLERKNGGWFVVGLRADSTGDYYEVDRPQIVTRTDGFFSLGDSPTNESEAQAWMVEKVMKWLMWSRLSKDLAKDMGWDVVQTRY